MQNDINLAPWRNKKQRRLKKMLVVLLSIILLFEMAVASDVVHHLQAKTHCFDQYSQQLNTVTEQMAKQNQQDAKSNFGQRIQTMLKARTSWYMVMHFLHDLGKISTQSIVVMALQYEGENWQLHGIAQSPTKLSAYVKHYVAPRWQHIQTQQQATGEHAMLFNLSGQYHAKI